jgi:hypothetical protein
MKGLNPFFSRGIAYFVVSSCLSDVITYKIRNKEYRPNLYLGLSSIAGIGKKSTLMEEAMDIYEDVILATSKNQTDAGIISDFSSAEGILRKLQELDRIVFEADEFDSLLKSMGDKGDYRAHTMAVLNSLYYGKRFTITRAKEDIIVKKGKTVGMIFGMHRPRDYFSKEHLKSGFVRRLMVLMLFNEDLEEITSAPQYTDDEYYEIEDTLLQSIRKELIELRTEYMKRKHVVQFEGEVKRRFEKLYVENYNKSIKDESLTSFIGVQYEEMLQKLTALTALGRYSTTATVKDYDLAKDFLDRVFARWNPELRSIAHERTEKIYEEDNFEEELLKYIDNDNEGFCKWADIRRHYRTMSKPDLVKGLEKLFDQNKIIAISAKKFKPSILFTSRLSDQEAVEWAKGHLIKSIKDKNDPTKYTEISIITEKFVDYFK